MDVCTDEMIVMWWCARRRREKKNRNKKARGEKGKGNVEEKESNRKLREKSKKRIKWRGRRKERECVAPNHFIESSSAAKRKSYLSSFILAFSWKNLISITVYILRSQYLSGVGTRWALYSWYKGWNLNPVHWWGFYVWCIKPAENLLISLKCITWVCNLYERRRQCCLMLQAYVKLLAWGQTVPSLVKTGRDPSFHSPQLQSWLNNFKPSFTQCETGQWYIVVTRYKIKSWLNNVTRDPEMGRYSNV